jgi:hypothetical protein
LRFQLLTHYDIIRSTIVDLHGKRGGQNAMMNGRKYLTTHLASREIRREDSQNFRSRPQSIGAEPFDRKIRPGHRRRNVALARISPSLPAG